MAIAPTEAGQAGDTAAADTAAVDAEGGGAPPLGALFENPALVARFLNHLKALIEILEILKRSAMVSGGSSETASTLTAAVSGPAALRATAAVGDATRETAGTAAAQIDWESGEDRRVAAPDRETLRALVARIAAEDRRAPKL